MNEMNAFREIIRSTLNSQRERGYRFKVPDDYIFRSFKRKYIKIKPELEKKAAEDKIKSDNFIGPIGPYGWYWNANAYEYKTALIELIKSVILPHKIN